MDEERAEEAGWDDFQRAIIGALAGALMLAGAIAGGFWFWWW